MTTTLSQLRRLTRLRLGIPLSDNFMQDPVLDDHINLAIAEIDSEQRWPWSEVLDDVPITPAIPDIVVAENWRATRAVFDAQRELFYVAPGDLLARTSSVGAPPRVWCPLGDRIAIRPATQGDLTLTHYWYRRPAWLREDADQPDIPDQFAGSIVAKAAELLSMREGAGADSTRHHSEYTDWVTRMRRDVRRSTPPTRVRVRPGSWI